MEHTALDIFIDLLFIVVLQVLGILSHVMKKISELGDKFPDKNRSEIVAIFKKEDWDSMAISGIILLIWVTNYLALHRYGKEVIPNIPYFPISYIGLSLVIGFCGQMLLYKILGTAQNVLSSGADKLEQKLK